MITRLALVRGVPLDKAERYTAAHGVRVRQTFFRRSAMSRPYCRFFARRVTAISEISSKAAVTFQNFAPSISSGARVKTSLTTIPPLFRLALGELISE
jgi:hypothetical protein